MVSQSGFSSSPINIKENCWIAAKATILKGVTIGENSVIGAHALVNKDVETGVTVVGVPARKVIM